MGFGQLPQGETIRRESPDLVVTSASVAPAQARAGDAVWIWFRVENIGRGAAGDSVTEVFLSRDVVLGDDDRLWVQGIRMPPLNPGEWFDYTAKTKTPSVCGPYHVLFRCDGENRLIELNEKNNFLDAGILQMRMEYTFDSGAEGWEWFPRYGEWWGFRVPDRSVVPGSLTMTEIDQMHPTIYGGWESSKDPAIAAHPTSGSFVRVRYHMRSSVSGPSCPGFRFRANTAHAENIGGQWFISPFLTQDWNSSMEVFYYTYDVVYDGADTYVPGREPGPTGQIYTLLYRPEPTPTLEVPDVVTYFSSELVDLDWSWNDAGTLYLDQVDIDYLNCPPLGSGRPEPALSTRDFSLWKRWIFLFGSYTTTAGLEVKTGPTSISITVAPGNRMFVASAYSPGVFLEPGRYYRMVFTVTADTPAGYFEPNVRTGLVSSKYVFGGYKHLRGGATWASFGTAPQPFEMWVVAPTEHPATPGLTEAMQLWFTCWVAENPVIPFCRTMAGTVRCHEVFTESYPAF